MLLQYALVGLKEALFVFRPTLIETIHIFLPLAVVSAFLQILALCFHFSLQFLLQHLHCLPLDVSTLVSLFVCLSRVRVAGHDISVCHSANLVIQRSVEIKLVLSEFSRFFAKNWERRGFALKDHCHWF